MTAAASPTGQHPAAGRIMYLRYDEYIEKWDEIAGIFPPDAIRKGAFDKYAEENTAKRGTIKVDEAFLEEIENWRILLARNIALRNPQVENERQLNFAVQKTIDRIIFLRICEDRGIEPLNQLYELGKGKRFTATLWSSIREQTSNTIPACSISKRNRRTRAMWTPSHRPSPSMIRCSR